MNKVNIEKVDSNIEIEYLGEEKSMFQVFWVAHILDTLGTHELIRSFINRGKTVTITIDGFYQIFVNKEAPVYFKVSSGEIEYMTKEAVIEEIEKIKKAEIKKIIMVHRRQLREYYKDMQKYWKKKINDNALVYERGLDLSLNHLLNIFEINPIFRHRDKYKEFVYNSENATRKVKR